MNTEIKKKKILINKILSLSLILLLTITTFFQLPIIFGLENEKYTYLSKWGSPGLENGQFNSPHGVFTDLQDNVYVIEELNCRVQKFTPNGTFILKWGKEGSEDGQFNLPHAGAIDHSGNIYIVEWNGNRVQKFSTNGTYILKWGSTGTGEGQFTNPHGIAVDSQNNVYVTDVNNNRIQKFTSNGTFITQWGSQGTDNNQFNGPRGIAIDSTDVVYVVDLGNDCIKKFTYDGKFIAKWGSWGSGESQFKYPRGIAIDSIGSVYVSDINNNRIQKFTPEGIFQTQFGELGIGDGQFNELCGISVNSQGLVYLTDVKNNRMQIFKPIVVPEVVIDSFNVSKTRCDVNSTQTVILHAKWSNNSNVEKGTIGLNEKDYETDNFGSITFTVTSKKVTKTTWNISKIDCNGASKYTEIPPTPSIIWDCIIITSSGVSSKSTTTNQIITVWYKANYQYDGMEFNAERGTLYVNGEAMTWSTPNNRWEKTYTSTEPKTLKIKITSIQDNLYRLTAISETTQPIDVEWMQQSIPGYSIISIVTALVIVSLLMMNKKSLSGS